MRVEGLLLDVGFEGRDAVIWIRDPDKGRVKLREAYHPELYAEPKDVTPEGEFNSRGIELRRRDTPPYVSGLQQRVIERLLTQPTASEVRTTGLRRAKEEVEASVKDLMEGRVPEEELRVSTVLRRTPAEYAGRPGHVVAAEALAMNHAPPDVGTLVDYLHVDAANQNPFRRVRPASFQGGRIDLKKYVELVEAAAETVLSPLEARRENDFPSRRQR